MSLRLQPEEVDSFLLPLSVGRLPGVGKVTKRKAEELDVQKVGDCANWMYGTRRALRSLWRPFFTNWPAASTKVKSSRQAHTIVSAEDTFERDVPLTETGP